MGSEQLILLTLAIAERYSNYSRPLPIDIIIPFYKQPSLVKGLFESLHRVGEELAATGCQVIAINDSPDDAELKPLLRKAVEDLSAVIPCRLIENTHNIGFGRSVNGAASGLGGKPA